MVVWTGWGILAGLIWAASLFLTQLFIDPVYEAGYYTANVWPKIVASLLSAPIIWLVGRWMNGSPQSQSRRQNGAAHTLFWIPMEYWGLIFLVIGVIIAVVHKLQGN
jgi:hypothetical protein